MQITELEPNNYHLIIVGWFENGKTGNWVIDTGASKTVFDKNLVEHYTVLEGESDEIYTAGIGDGPQEISIAILTSLQLGKLKIENQKVALLDLSHINEMYSKVTSLTICGLLGGDFLMKYKAVIDYKDQLLMLRY